MREQKQSLKRKSSSKRKFDPHATGIRRGAHVGRDIPDESKERHTEIAVDLGKKIAAEVREKVGSDHE